MNSSLHAEYVAELVRTLMFDVFQQETYTRGLNVYTTINSEDQNYAYQSLRSHVQAFMTAPVATEGRKIRLTYLILLQPSKNINNALQEALVAADMPAVVVLKASPTEVVVQNSSGKQITIKGKNLDFVKNSLQPKAKPDLKIERGSVVRIQSGKNNEWEITQLPQAGSRFYSNQLHDRSHSSFGRRL